MRRGWPVLLKTRTALIIFCFLLILFFPALILFCLDLSDDQDYESAGHLKLAGNFFRAFRYIN